jgi:outer membrane protein assembly factor BamB
MVAFDKDTGRILWKATSDDASYSSPVAATFGGGKKIVFFTREGLVLVNPETGEVSHKLQWRARMNASVNAAVPLVFGDDIFLSASYGTGATLIHVDGAKLEQVWSTEDALTNHYATSVYSGGTLFGYHGRQEYTQTFRAIEAKTGKLLWEESGFGAGTVTLADGRLLLLRENGELVLAEASPEAFKPIARARILDGTVRAYPALADGLLYARNTGTLVCVDLRKQPL